MTMQRTRFFGRMPYLAALWILIMGAAACAQPAGTLDDLWQGNARLVEVGELDWVPTSKDTVEQAGWFATQGGVWYAFNRSSLSKTADYCPQDHDSVVVRASKDRGRTWSAPVSAVVPGDSTSGDGCAVLDGSVYYDAPTSTWHMLAQCLDRQNLGGWAMCHYTRVRSPLGRFVPDIHNPVVKGGALWSRICSGSGKACPVTTKDEGTPDIIGKKNGLFIVTMHGFDATSKAGFRGVVATPDFRRWDVSGNGLPDDATLGPADCRAWLKACNGVGEATTLSTSRYRYMVVETMDKGLLCVTGQQWVFQLVRAPYGAWPRSGSVVWRKRPGPALLVPTNADTATLCPVRYARWLVDGRDTYLVYEDWSSKQTSVRRRLLKLVPVSDGQSKKPAKTIR